MKNQKAILSIFVLSLSAIIGFTMTACGSGKKNQLTITSGNVTQVSTTGTYDTKICETGLAKAKELSLDPACVFADNGSLSIAPGYTVQIKNGSYSFNQDNLVINAGQEDVIIGSTQISTGEMAVWQNNRFVKLPQ